MSENGSAAPIMHARGLRKEYGSGEGLVRAVDEVDLTGNLAVPPPWRCSGSSRTSTQPA